MIIFYLEFTNLQKKLETSKRCRSYFQGGLHLRQLQLFHQSFFFFIQKNLGKNIFNNPLLLLIGLLCTGSHYYLILLQQLIKLYNFKSKLELFHQSFSITPHWTTVGLLTSSSHAPSAANQILLFQIKVSIFPLIIFNNPSLDHCALAHIIISCPLNS